MKARSLVETGLRAHQAGDLATGIAAYRQALAFSPDDAIAHNLLGTALLQQGSAADALPHLERAARRQRDNAGLLGNLAQGYFALGRFDEARETFRKASRINPREPRFQLGIANSLAMQGRFEEAEPLLQRASQRFPDDPLIWFNYGNVLRESGRPQASLEKFERALSLAPDFVDARNNRAAALHNLQRFDEAEAEFRACIAMAPDYLLARCNLASVLIDLGRFGEAADFCREVIARNPRIAEAHTFLGAALGHMGRLMEALACHRTAARLTPGTVKVIETYAGALTDLGFFSSGLREFAQALALNPASVPARQMLGTALLARGALAEGWAEYVHRPARIRFCEKYAGVTLALALPEDLRDRHVCLLREQGLGDEIFFLRYAQALKALGARVTYRASNKIRSLFERVDALDAVLGETDPLPDADHTLLIGDLPHALGASAASALQRPPRNGYRACMRDFAERIGVFWPRIPAPLPLEPLADRIAAVRKALADAGPPPYLGVTWRGGTPPQEQQGVSWVLYKEVPIERLAAAVADFPGTVLSLQRKPLAEEAARFAASLGRPIHDFSAYNEDLESMLALLALIEEYVGVSNTNVHMRAGVGGVTRVLVPCPAEWRWFASGARSPWFPDVPVYRQSTHGDWTAALEALSADLRAAHRVTSR